MKTPRCRSWCGTEDRFTFSIDASGERLHRRGARIEVGAAPLRETLAAGLLALAGWAPICRSCDPMCGAGTIVIEAALQAIDKAPGIGRAFAGAFAIDRWPLFAAERRCRCRGGVAPRRARARICPKAPAPIVGSDRDPRAVESARHNAARAEVAAQITLASRDVADARLLGGTLTGLIANSCPTGVDWPIRGRRSRSTAIWAARCARTFAAGGPRSWCHGLSTTRRGSCASTSRPATRWCNGGLPIELCIAEITA